MATETPPNPAQEPENPSEQRVHTVGSFRNLVQRVQAPIREAALCPSQEPRLALTDVDIYPDDQRTSIILLLFDSEAH